MDRYKSLGHSVWECKYQDVFTPRCRWKTIYKELRKHLGEVFRRIAEICPTVSHECPIGQICYAEKEAPGALEQEGGMGSYLRPGYVCEWDGGKERVP